MNDRKVFLPGNEDYRVSWNGPFILLEALDGGAWKGIHLLPSEIEFMARVAQNLPLPSRNEGA